MKASFEQPEIVIKNGKPVSVILPIAAYGELLERLEDAEDLAELKRIRQRPQQYRPIEEYLAERAKK